MVSETTLEKIKAMLEQGQTLYAARAEWSYYSGSLVSGRTAHFPIITKGQPVPKLGFKRNKQLGLVELFGGVIFADSVTVRHYDTPSCDEGFTIYIAKEPFSVWIEHRGYTGDRSDNYDRIVTAKPITSVQELLELYK